ncbi:MAG: ribonuclease HII [Pseudohongiellaceae bacterium]|nr:ribonuclease HII [Pseudohongiellaceae bacterium]
MQLDFDYPQASAEPVAGVDEVGRGPLAGDVVAAAVILHPEHDIPYLDDSKKLTEKRREVAFEAIIASCVCYSLGRASPAEIDEINILHASLLAMKRAVEGLSEEPGFVYVDGLHCPKWHYPSAAIVKGDSRVASIAAASILAKVTRDREMITLDQQYPGYGFAGHKAYPTKAHMQALERLGPCPAHRRSYKPVQRFL